ncbi:MAG: diphthine--ammonia ligase, partial [Thermoplasmata archaeon]|nr:diphthine--ammonia ligase [Thermoplasmata archaeon]
KEKELGDLKHAIEKARDEFAIEGIVTGAIESVYQATRVQRMCHELGLWCYNPLWKKDQVELLNELVETGFHAIVSGIFAYPLTEHWLGKNIDKDMIKELIKLNRKYQISPSGEGGELETTVLDAPLFRKRIVLDEWNIKAKEHAGVLSITRAHLGNK